MSDNYSSVVVDAAVVAEATAVVLVTTAPPSRPRPTGTPQQLGLIMSLPYCPATVESRIDELSKGVDGRSSVAN